eukprot:Filipodium_phascolosomae@DN5875_c0_g1_i1.p1
MPSIWVTIGGPLMMQGLFLNPPHDEACATVDPPTQAPTELPQTTTPPSSTPTAVLTTTVSPTFSQSPSSTQTTQTPLPPSTQTPSQTPTQDPLESLTSHLGNNGPTHTRQLTLVYLLLTFGSLFF